MMHRHFTRREHRCSRLRNERAKSRQMEVNGAVNEASESSATLYDILGISWSASQKDIRKAYGSLAKQYHPDVTGNDAQSTEYFYLIKDAYEVLSDEIRRARYNNVLMSQGYVPPKGSVRRSQELGMSEWQFYLVVLLVNPFYLFLLGPLFGIKVEDVKGFLGLN
jgi:preprotein translocase subunit Sec63